MNGMMRVWNAVFILHHRSKPTHSGKECSILNAIEGRRQGDDALRLKKGRELFDELVKVVWNKSRYALPNVSTTELTTPHRFGIGPEHRGSTRACVDQALSRNWVAWKSAYLPQRSDPCSVTISS